MRPLRSPWFNLSLSRAAAPAPLWRETFALGVIVLAIATVALAFAWPWRATRPASDRALARYLPLHDGQSTLLARFSADGTPIGWESQNLVIVPLLNVFTTLREAPLAVIDRFYARPGESTVAAEETARLMKGVEVVEGRSRTLDSSGGVTETTTLYLRERRGHFLVGQYTPAGGDELVFDPPLLLLPAGLESGREWESSGQVRAGPQADGSGFEYRASGRVLEAGPFERRIDANDPPNERFDDCLEIEMRLGLYQGEASLLENVVRSWYCAGVGPIESESFDAMGQAVGRDLLLAGNGLHPPAPLLPPPAGSAPEEPPSGEPGDWRLARFGEGLPRETSGENTIAPVWIPFDSPLVLAATYDGDLVAFDPSGAVRWRFHPGGTVYGRPAFDPRRSYIYFGATDRRLYALDRHGLFLWSFLTGDNVATRPLVVGETVVFGSEDGSIYGIDATTGDERWRGRAGAAVVSDPVLAGGLVVIGADDGRAYALDPAGGEVRWTYATERAIEAPIVGADDTVYIASRDGTLSAVDPSNGEVRWVSRVGLGSAGTPVRTAPAVTGDRLFVVDSAGALSAFDRTTGILLWTITDDPGTLVGPPVVAGDTVIVSRNDGFVVRFGVDGERRGQWAARDVTGPDDAPPVFSLGPTEGGGSLWFGDAAGVIYRLGPEREATRLEDRAAGARSAAAGEWGMRRTAPGD